MNAINAYNRLNANVAGLKKASEKLASGYRINRAGDDAAGLAISEKMRSQIRGLNQATRNAQDGINMIQTFEGAAQETHNILQRMKELAVESANGTYDNATDRAAIQLEFEQLNDELNQIADTDFNGTIVLNGGVMADGVTQTNGEFDYATYYAEQKAAAAEAAANAPLEVLDYTADNRSVSKAEAVEKIVDNQKYSTDAAAALWETLGIEAKDYDEVNITFKKDGDDWVAAVAVDKDGNVIEEIDLSAIKGDASPDAGMTGTGKGGFKVEWSDANNTYDVDAIFDAYAAKDGDYLTIKFTNTPSTTHAPDSAGVMEDALTGTGFNVTVTLDPDNVTDDEMSAELEAALNELESLEFTIEEDIENPGQAKITIDPASLTNLTFDDTTGEVSYTDKDGNVKKIATITGTYNGAAAAATVDKDGSTVGGNTGDDITGDITASGITASGTYTLVTVDGTDYWVSDDAAVLTYGDGQDIDLEQGGGTNVTVGEGDTLTLDENGNITKINVTDASVRTDQPGDLDSAATGITGKAGDYVFSGGKWYRTSDLIDKSAIQVDGGDAGVGDIVKVDVAGGSTTFTVNTDGHKYDADAGAACNSTTTSDAAKEALGLDDSSSSSDGPTKADAFGNSTARLTYADHIILQTGARSKDAVDFTFAYNTDGSADMGTLKANLNLSARAEGLNTANLSLATQDAANQAIDQIDKAINKVSMVRATFGAIQNRLEHKITNLTTTAENLTEAESSIRDTDMAQEMMNYTKFNILQQAAQSMLAQANQQPQSILQLLG